VTVETTRTAVCDKCGECISDAAEGWPVPNEGNEPLPAGWSHVLRMTWVGHGARGLNEPWRVERYCFCPDCEVTG
jgi:hypothetical protein